MNTNGRSYRDSYEALPDTEDLDHVKMQNSSAVLDYDRAANHIMASRDFLGDVARDLVARATTDRS